MAYCIFGTCAPPPKKRKITASWKILPRQSFKIQWQDMYRFWEKKRSTSAEGDIFIKYGTISCTVNNKFVILTAKKGGAHPVQALFCIFNWHNQHNKQLPKETYLSKISTFEMQFSQHNNLRVSKNFTTVKCITVLK